MSAEEKQRLVGVDLLRGIAAFFIVGCHLQLLQYTDLGWSLLHFCDMNVGAFSALSGYMMAYTSQRQESVHDFQGYVSKRMRRLLPTYVIWSLVYLVATAILQYFLTGAINPKYTTPRWWLNVLFWGDAATHLWFIASLFYAQILLFAALNRMSKIFWITISFVLILISAYWDSWYATYPLRLVAFLMLGFGVCGIEKKIGITWSSVALFCGLIAHAVFPIKGFIRDWIVVIPVLLFFPKVTINSTATAYFFGNTSMGIFLIHPLMTVAFSTIIKRLIQPPYGVCEVAIVWIGAWLCSLGITVAILKTKKLAWIVR